jgi:hypothetical protein
MGRIITLRRYPKPTARQEYKYNNIQCSHDAIGLEPARSIGILMENWILAAGWGGSAEGGEKKYSHFCFKLQK